MTEEEVAQALRAWRKLRRGTMRPDAVPAFLRPFLAHGPGPACGELAVWVGRSVADPRAAEAAMRFFGLDSLPESLSQIGAGLGPRYPGDHPGIGPRQVEKLVRRALTDMTRRGIEPPVAGGGALPRLLRDPFPPPHDPTMRRWMGQAVVWGWAQVPPGDQAAASALLYYEYEHALRAGAPGPSSRVERQRWRRLAWSVLQVASHRATLAAGARRPARVGEHPGVQLLAVGGDDSEPDGLAALTAVSADPGRLDEPDLARPALEIVRTAVREGRPEAAELLRLLNDGAARHRAASGSIPPPLESKLITLSAIVARERRDPAGIPAARAGLRRIDELLGSPSASRDHATWVWHVESGYRTNQELADLYAGLGMFAHARAAADVMRARLRRFGDPDPSYLPDGWHWELLVTESNVNRHLARTSAAPQPWLRAAAIAARQAAELASGLPQTQAIASENQIIAVKLDRLADAPYRGSREGKRLLDEVARRLRRLGDRSQRIEDHRNRDTRRVLLHVQILSWRLALLQADPAAIRTSRALVRQARRRVVDGARL